MTENDLQTLIMRELSRGNTRLFRNNTGLGWCGTIQEKTPTRLVLTNPRPLHAGLCKGSSDLIGWRSVEITQDMVGCTVAVFTAIEVKSKNGRVTNEQQRFIDVVRGAGGIGAIVRSLQEAHDL